MHSSGYIFDGQVVFNEGAETIYAKEYSGKEISRVSIPDTILNIQSAAFASCRDLTSITIPDSVNKIGPHCFEGCTGLTSVVLPNGLEVIDECVFKGCTSLQEIIIPDSVTIIADGAFSGCSSLSRIILPGNLRIIGSRAFAECGLESIVVLPFCIESIGQDAFYKCPMTKIHMVPLALPPGRSIYSNDSYNINNPRTPRANRYSNFLTMEDEEPIYSALYAPASTTAQKWFKIQVHLYDERDAIRSNQKAQALDKNATVMDFNPLSMQIELGTQVKAELTIYEPGVLIPHSTYILTWKGALISANFMAKITDASLKSISGEVMLYVSDVPVGTLTFNVDVVSESALDDLLKSGTSKKFKSVFISYSHIDTETAEAMASTCRALEIKYFYDRHTLESGDVFNEVIAKSIEESDLFLLLWSQNAAQSDYVEKEYLHAIQYAYPQMDREKATLCFKPLCINPKADPPDKLKNIYNFSTVNTN